MAVPPAPDDRSGLIEDDPQPSTHGAPGARPADRRGARRPDPRVRGHARLDARPSARGEASDRAVRAREGHVPGPAVHPAGQHLRPRAARRGRDDAGLPRAGARGDHRRSSPPTSRRRSPRPRRPSRRPGSPAVPRSSAPASRSSTATPPRPWWPARSRTPTPTRTTTPSAIDDLPLPFRVQVELVKVDGEWLVDNFTPVTGEAQAPAETPSGSRRSPSQPRPRRRRRERHPQLVRPARRRARRLGRRDPRRWKAAIADLDPTDRRFRTLNQAAEVLLDPDREGRVRRHARTPVSRGSARSAEPASRSRSPDRAQPEPRTHTGPEPTVDRGRSVPGLAPRRPRLAGRGC